MFRTVRRHAVRSLAATTIGAVGLGLAVPAVAFAAGPPPDQQWGANQARPVTGTSPVDGHREVAPTRKGMQSAAVAAGTSLASTGMTAAPSWVFNGSGWGHGIGMSQYGAFEMAKAGYTAAQILQHYYSGTTYDAVPDSMWVNVNIVYGASSASATTSQLVSGNGGGGFTLSLGGKSMTSAVPANVAFSVSGGVVQASCSTCQGSPLSGPQAILNWDHAPYTGDRTLVRIGGSQYRDGALIITPKSSTTMNVVNQVRVHDEYLDYIAESPWSWNLESLRAQAAAARGYVLAKYNSLGKAVQTSCNCHVFDTTSDQVYGGYSTVLSNGNAPYWANWKNAVHATGSSNTTTGYVARSKGSIISAFFSSSSGGRTENNEDVWGGTPLPYLRGVDDPWSLMPSNPLRAWRQVAGGGSLAATFGLSDVARLDLSDRTVNGGIHTATATSSYGTVRTITGDQVRTIVASGSPYSGRVNSTMIRHLTRRLSGADRYATAAAVATQSPLSATSVVIAGADGALVDASVSGPLAATVAGPLLLTRRDALPAPTVAELNRRGKAVKTAYVIGSEAVVSKAVASALTQRGITVVRLGGANRYATSALVAQAIKAKRAVPTVVLASGTDVPDTLVVSGPASALREPILLTPTTGLDTSTRTALAATRSTSARVVGNESQVSAAVVAQLKAAGVTTVTRLDGADRYAVSGSIASFYRSKLPDQSEAVLTSGSDATLVDSLVAGTLQRLVVLSAGTSLGDQATVTLQTSPLLETLTAVGGPTTVSAATLAAAANS